MVDPELFERYQKALGTNADLTKRAVEALISKLEGLAPLEQAEYLMANYPKLVKAYGRVAADVARQYYQEQRDRHFEGDDDASEYTAQPSAPIQESWAYEDVQKAASDGLGYLPKVAVRRAMQRADQTIAYNVGHDPARPRWAIVPHMGACGWCVMVASNGWAYSERSVNAQRHDGCKCSVAVDFDRDSPSLAGYDPDELRRQYARGIDDAGGEEGIRAKWDALSSEEQAKYRRKGRSAYDVFKTQQVAKAMDARSKRVETYRGAEKALERDVKAAKVGGIKVPQHVWDNRMDNLLQKAGIPQDAVRIQLGADFQPHELMLVGRLVTAGRDVEVLRASSAPGTHTPDFRVDGVPMEAKRLEAWSEDRLGKKIWEASAQSRDVIVDLSLETVSRGSAIRKAKEELETPMYRYLSKYEKKRGYSRGSKELRVDSVMLVFHDGIEMVTR